MESPFSRKRGHRSADHRSELQLAIRALLPALAGVGLFSFFINLLMLVPPLYMLQVYDRILASRSASTLLLITVIVVFMFVTMWLLEVVRSRIMNRLGTQFETGLSERVYNAMFATSLANPSQSHGQALEDLRHVRTFISGRALTAFIDLPWVPAFLGLLFLFHPWYGWFGLFAIVVIATVALINEWTTKKPLGAASGSSVAARNLVASQTRNAEVVEAMGMMPRLRQRWQDTYQSYLSSQGDAGDRGDTWTTLSKTLRLLAQSLMLGLGAWLAIQLEVTAGMVIAGSIILGRALAPIDQLIGSWKQFTAARGGYERLDDLLAQFPPSAQPMELPAPSGDLLVEGLVVRPPGTDRVVVRGVSFELSAGEALGVVGPSGAGKSSLARALLSVWKPLAGTVRLDGADLSRWSRDQLGPHVGYLPQDIELFAGSVAENIARFGEFEPAAVVDAAQRVGVHQMILQLPEHYDTQIGQGGAALSGGQRQRIALARAVFGKPCLLVLDEPNASLDDQGEADLLEALERMKQAGTTVVLISHRPGILMRMDKLLVMKEGAVAAFGSRDEILPRLTGKVPRIGNPSGPPASGPATADPPNAGSPSASPQAVATSGPRKAPTLATGT
jgi:ATP-binding cassette, subfamily C, bacterial EexD